ncbi:hypothetical protein MAR_026827 [Mya arenaria]|uniref:CUB domain-containing protein n=1 Tax=Mya arenaria TaxID=6604 RepID=A0ABY7ETU3_MYAAR|nr:hypothetical protein MAR_026827 [Mya arenaria]
MHFVGVVLNQNNAIGCPGRLDPFVLHKTSCMVIYFTTFLRMMDTLCNEKVDMEAKGIQQGELELAINTNTGSDSRVSCDFTVTAENGRHVMFYFTDLFLGSPNFTERVDRACIEPRDINGNYETFLAGSCRTTERKCNNERCIAHDIVCNDRNPCGDNSDCPTGLEHLSSWAMSGIVILALLCGGIVIIMATVCLQRAGNKNYDLDDVTIPANGMVHHECPHVEMNEVPNIDKKPHTNLTGAQNDNLSMKVITNCPGLQRRVKMKTF